MRAAGAVARRLLALVTVAVAATSRAAAGQDICSSAECDEMKAWASRLATAFSGLIDTAAGGDAMQDRVAALAADPAAHTRYSVDQGEELTRIASQLAEVVDQQVAYIDTAHDELVAEIARSSQSSAESAGLPNCAGGGEADTRCVDAWHWDSRRSTHQGTKVLPPFSAELNNFSPVNDRFSTMIFAPNVNVDSHEVRLDAKITSSLDNLWATNHRHTRDPQRPEYRGEHGITLWQYFGSQSGFMRFFPGLERTPDEFDFGAGFDHRERPWYAGAATSGKNIVILADKSGSMQDHNRWTASMDAINSVLRTLTPKDWVSIVLFDSTSSDGNPEHVFDCFGGRLVRATPQNVGRMKDWLDLENAPGWPCKNCQRVTLRPGGGTNFKDAFTRAFATFDSSADADGCDNMILFMTDGQHIDQDYGKFTPAFVADLQSRSTRDIVIFSYAFGAQAQAHKENPLAVACQNGGVFAEVQDRAQGGEELKKQMAQFYQYYAQYDAAKSSTAKVWSAPYVDGGGLGLVVSITRPVYDVSGVLPRFFGVIASDVHVGNLLQSLRSIEGDLSYAFVTNAYGQVLTHPVLADPKSPRYSEKGEAGEWAAFYYVDIADVETGAAFRDQRDRFLNVAEGQKVLGQTVQIQRQIPNGDIADFEGVSYMPVDVTYNFMRVGEFRVCLVLADADRSSIRFRIPAAVQNAGALPAANRSYYHRIDLGRCDIAQCSRMECCDHTRMRPPRSGTVAELTASQFRSQSSAAQFGSAREFDVYESGYNAASGAPGPGAKSGVFFAASSFDSPVEWIRLAAYYRSDTSYPGQAAADAVVPGFGPNGETEAHVKQMQDHINLVSSSVSGPGLKRGVRDLAYYTQPLEEHWRKHYIDDAGLPKRDCFGLYIGLETGMWRNFPARNSWYSYDPTIRPWYLRAKANIMTTALSTPYVDSQTNDVVITISKTVMMPCGEGEQGCRQRPSGHAVSTKKVVGVVGYDYLYDDFVRTLKAHTGGVCQGNVDGDLCVLLDGAGMVVALMSASTGALDTAKGSVFLGDDGTIRSAGGGPTFDAALQDVAEALRRTGVMVEHTMHDYVSDMVYHYFRIDPEADVTPIEIRRDSPCSSGAAKGALVRVKDYGGGGASSGSAVFLLALRDYYPKPCSLSYVQNPRPYAERLDVCVDASGRGARHTAATGVCRPVSLTQAQLARLRTRPDGRNCCAGDCAPGGGDVTASSFAPARRRPAHIAAYAAAALSAAATLAAWA